jgi:alpha-mannosidase
MMRLKRQHRRLEHALYLTEKLATTAWAQGLAPYPADELAAATRALLASEFHDILPGSTVPSAEEAALAELGHGLTLVTRVRTRAFFAMTQGQKPGTPDTHPILVYNPHPFPVNAVVECEMQPAWPDRPEQFGVPTVMAGRRAVPSQAEKEESNINEDHRKRVAFLAKLAPSSMNRFDCRFHKVSDPPVPSLRERDGKIRFRTTDLQVVINTRTGLIDRYRIHGKDYVAAGAAAALLMRDDANPWAMHVRRFRTPAGRFRLMRREDAAHVAGASSVRMPAVRVVEDGPVRAVVEALFRAGDSTLCHRYKLPRVGTEIELETRVHWNAKDRMLKLSFPTPWSDGLLSGQVAYGTQALPSDGDEAVAQQWVAVLSPSRDRALTVINDSTYGCDAKRGELRLSLLRAPAHAAHPSDLGTPLLEPNRYTPRIDQGEHVFRFWINGGRRAERLNAVDREALVHNQRPYALSCWPAGGGDLPASGPVLSDRAIQLAAFKRAEDGEDVIVRLFEPTGKRRTTTLSVPCVGASVRLRLDPFELKTLRLDRRSKRFHEVSLLEE